MKGKRKVRRKSETEKVKVKGKGEVREEKQEGWNEKWLMKSETGDNKRFILI